MNAPIRQALALTLLAILAAPAHSQPPASECPQPRFTGSAPAEYLAMKNPLREGRRRARRRAYLPRRRRIDLVREVPRREGRRSRAHVDDVQAGAAQFPLRGDGHRHPRRAALLDHPLRLAGASMPPHPELDDAQIWALVSYLRRLAN